MKNRLVYLFTALLIILVKVGNVAASPTQTTALHDVSTTETFLQEPVTINYWEWRGGALAAFNEAEANLFHEQYPWITLNVTQFPDRNSYQNALNLAFESDDTPDVFLMTRSLTQIVQAGWAQPLDPWITPEWKAKFPDNIFVNTRTMLDGETYTFPAYASGSNRMLYLNEEMFREAGLIDDSGAIHVPQTWGELRTMAKQITEAGNGDYYGIGLGIKDSRAMSWWFDLAGLAGAPMLPYDFDFRTGEYVYSTHPAFAQIVELLLGMRDDGSVYPYGSTVDDGNISTLFAQGEFAIMMTGPYAVSNMRRDFPDFQDYRIVPLPIPDAGQTGDFYLVPSSGTYLLSAKSNHPEAAWLWMEWLSSREYNQRMVAATSNFSIFSDLNTAENINDPHALQAYQALQAYGVYGPYPPALNPATAQVVPEAITPDIGDLLIGIYTGQITDWRQALIDLDAHKRAAWDAALKNAQDSGADVSADDFIFPDWNPMENYGIPSVG